MSILIEGMEMPNKKNGWAVLIIYPDGKCAFEDGKTYQAVSVPPHGDLIERKAICLTDFEIAMCDGDYKEGMKMLLDKAESAPSIIPASEEGAE